MNDIKTDLLYFVEDIFKKHPKLGRPLVTAISTYSSIRTWLIEKNILLVGSGLKTLRKKYKEIPREELDEIILKLRSTADENKGIINLGDTWFNWEHVIDNIQYGLVFYTKRRCDSCNSKLIVFSYTLTNHYGNLFICPNCGKFVQFDITLYIFPAPAAPAAPVAYDDDLPF
ncbi:MAG: hypothetical protein OSJ55_08950 [Bacteroidales bacterium]|nr:hypothetical protein [Bacteroidales bacterium]